MATEDRKETPNLNNSVGLHPDNKSWSEFLAQESHVVKSTFNGWIWNVYSNHHYLVDPEGFVSLEFGFNGYTKWAELTGDKHIYARD